MEGFDYWRLCDELSIAQAADLIVGMCPGGMAALVEQGTELTPSSDFRYRTNLEAATTALANAVRSGRLRATIRNQDHLTYDGVSDTWFDEGGDELNLHKTTIFVDDLRAWLVSRGVRTGFFFPTATTAPDYLDPQHPRYAPKLAAAVKAWLAVDDPKGKHPKQALDKWLREHAAEFGLTDDDGNAVNQAIEDCSKVANWQPGGGAPKTPAG